MTENQLNEEYKTLHYWLEGFNRALYAARLLHAGDEERKLLNEISSVSYKQSRAISNLYAKPMGTAVQRRLERGA